MEFPFSLLKIVLASTQGFFDLLAIFDVGYHVIPFDDLSIFISQWETSVKMPSVLPIGAAKTNLAFVRFATFNGPAPFAVVLVKIIGMDCRLPPCPGRLRRRHTRIIQESTVYVGIGAIRQRHPHYRRNSIDDVAKL